MVAERSGSTENARAERFEVIDRDRESPDLGAHTPDSETIGAVRRRRAGARDKALIFQTHSLRQ